VAIRAASSPQVQDIGFRGDNSSERAAENLRRRGPDRIASLVIPVSSGSQWKSNRSAIGARVVVHYGGKTQAQALMSQSSSIRPAIPVCTLDRAMFPPSMWMSIGQAEHVSIFTTWGRTNLSQSKKGSALYPDCGGRY
jgi:hypothetical protein